MTEENKKNSNKGCLPLIIGGIALLVVLSLVYDGLEKEQFGEEEYLTNSSWLLWTGIIALVIWGINSITTRK